MHKLPPLKAIHYFSATARHLSFSKAAHELCVTQSAISHQVKILEEFLNKQLLYRQGKLLSLTQAGEDFQTVAKDSLLKLAAVTDHILNEPKVSIRIVAQTSIAVDWLAPRLPIFNQLHPDIDFYFTMESSAGNFDPQEFDIIIGTWPTPDNFLTSQIREEFWFPVCTPELAKEITLTQAESILNYPLYSSENGQDWQLWIQKQALKMPDKININHLGLAILATKSCLQGMGFALSNYFLASDLIHQGKLTAFTQWQYQLPWGQYYVHYRQDKHNTHAINHFVSWLQKIV